MRRNRYQHFLAQRKSRCVLAIGLMSGVCAAMSATSEIQLPTYLSVRQDFPIELPDGCHAELRRASAFKKAPYAAYSDVADVASYDVMCVAREIRIDRPLRTNGGSVFLFSKRLVISAPIDTRVYFRAKTVDHFVRPAEWPQYDGKSVPYMGKIYNEKTRRVIDALTPGEPMAKLFRDYYSRCIDCVQTTSDTWLPELPSGLTPPFINWAIFLTADNRPKDYPRNGLAPPSAELNAYAVSSGNITIAASQLVAPGFTGPQNLSLDPLDCGPTVSFVQPLLDARGSRGGRGGLGQPNNCINDPLHRAGVGSSCDPRKEETGWNAAGGEGGDAGNITVLRFGPNAIDEALVRRISSADGGLPGSNRKVHVPHADRKIASVCEIPAEPTRWTSAKSGMPGIVRIGVETEPELWTLAQRTAKTFDAIFDHDLVELADRLRRDNRISSLTFDQHLRTSLTQMLAEAQRLLVERTIQVISETEIPKASRSETFWIPEAPSAGADFPTSTKVVFGWLRELENVGAGDDVQSYLYHRGGVLSSQAGQAQLITEIRSIRESILDSQEVLAKANQALVDMLEHQIDLDTRQLRADLQERALRLEREISTRIAEFNAKAKEANRAYRNGVLKYGKGIATFATSGNATELGQAFLELQALRGPDIPPIPELQALLGRAREFQETVEKAISRLRSDLRKNQIESVVSVLRAKATHEAMLSKRTQQFPDLYKAILTSYIHDPSHRESALRSNMSELFAYVDHAAEPSFSLQGDVVAERCNSVAADLGFVDRSFLWLRGWVVTDACLALAANTEDERTAYGDVKFQLAAKSLRLPIVVIRPFDSGLRLFNSQGFSEIDVDATD
jgi:hypothetical protein